MDEKAFKNAKTFVDLTNQLAEKKYAWSQHILLLSSTLFGILIALHNESSNTLGIRLCFSLAVALLGFGVLLTAIALYSHINALGRSRKVFLQESSDALNKRRDVKPVGVPALKIFVVCEIVGYICFFLCVALLSLYSILLVV
jgi:hypothetical protein